MFEEQLMDLPGRNQTQNLHNSDQVNFNSRHNLS